MLKHDIVSFALWPCRIWCLAGFPTYKYIDNNFQYIENKMYLIPLLGITINIILSVTYGNIKYDIDRYTFYSQLFSIHISVVISFVFSYHKKHKIRTILSRTLTVSTLLENIPRNCIISIKPKDLLIYAIIQAFLLTVVICSSIFRARFLDIEAIIRSYCFLSMQIYRYITEIMLLFLLTLLKQFYSNLVTIVRNSNQLKSDQFVFLTAFEIIFYLRNIAFEIRSAFQIQTLLKLFSDFIVSIPLLFYYIQSISEESTPFHVLLFKTSVTGLWNACTLLSTFTVALFLEKIEKLEATALEEIDKVSHNSQLLSYKKDELFQLRLNRNFVHFNVCGFFPLNCSYIYMASIMCVKSFQQTNVFLGQMVAGVTSYAVYLMQFHKSTKTSFKFDN